MLMGLTRSKEGYVLLIPRKAQGSGIGRATPTPLVAGVDLAIKPNARPKGEALPHHRAS